MQPAKRGNGGELVLCGAPPAKKAPVPPDEPSKSSLLRAFEAVVAAGRQGLLGPTARAAAEAMPDVQLEGSHGKAGQEAPSPAPLVEEKKGEEEDEEEKKGEEEDKKEEEEEKKEEKEESEEGRNNGKRERKGRNECIAPPLRGSGSSKPCKKEIWITGDSAILLSSRRAQFSHLGKQLGLPSSTASVIWRGFPMIMWDDLLPNLHYIYHQLPFPSIIIIHLGGNDLWRDCSSSLVTKMQNDLHLLQRALPDVVIIWSSLLPKPICKTSEELQDLESKRSNVNSEMEEYCTKNGICYLSHPLFTVENKALFLPDNTLNNEGADIFITDLKEILHTYLSHKKC